MLVAGQHADAVAKMATMENDGAGRLIGFKGEVTKENKCSNTKGTLMHHFTFDSANNWVDQTAGQLSSFMTTDVNGVRMSGQYEMMQKTQDTEWKTRVTQYYYTEYYYGYWFGCDDFCYHDARYGNGQICNRRGRPYAYCNQHVNYAYELQATTTKTTNYLAGYCNVASWNGDNMWVVAGSAANNKYSAAINEVVSQSQTYSEWLSKGGAVDDFGDTFTYAGFNWNVWYTHGYAHYHRDGNWWYYGDSTEITKKHHVKAAEYASLDDNHYCELKSSAKFQFKNHECRLAYDVRVYGHLEKDDKTCIAAENKKGETLTRTCRNGNQNALAHGTDDKTIYTNWFKGDEKFRIVLTAMTDGTYFNGHEIIGHDDVKVFCRACACPSCKIVKGEKDEEVIQVQHHNHESQEPNAVLKRRGDREWLNAHNKKKNGGDLNHRCYKSSDGVGTEGGHKKDLRKGTDNWKSVTLEKGDGNHRTGDNPTVKTNTKCKCVCDWIDASEDPNADLNAYGYKMINQ